MWHLGQGCRWGTASLGGDWALQEGAVVTEGPSAALYSGVCEGGLGGGGRIGWCTWVVTAIALGIEQGACVCVGGGGCG
jgi:hypothetical protein